MISFEYQALEKAAEPWRRGKIMYTGLIVFGVVLVLLIGGLIFLMNKERKGKGQ
jgi:hypothetical protein